MSTASRHGVQSMDLYIYYRVSTGRAQIVQERICAMQDELRQQTGVAASLKRRPHERDGSQTWMEVYPDVAAGFENLVEQAAARHGVAALLEGERHIEQFMDISTCA